MAHHHQAIEDDIALVGQGLRLLQAQLANARHDINTLQDLRERIDGDTPGVIADLVDSNLRLPQLQEIVHVPSIEWLLSRPRPDTYQFPTETVSSHVPLNMNAVSSTPSTPTIPPAMGLAYLEGEDREARKKRLRAERERDRRRRKRQLNELNGVIAPPTGGRYTGAKYMAVSTVSLDNKAAKTAARRERIVKDEIHYGYRCDGCGVDPIVGTRFACTQCPEQFSTNLCAACKTSGAYSSVHHHPSHRFKHHAKAQLNDDYDYLN